MIDSAQPIILLANYAVFGPGQIHAFPRVQSRMLLWCRGGAGWVTVNGRRIECEPGSAVLMPWEHSVRYEADADQPFEVAGVHLIPILPTGSPCSYGIVHGPDSPLLNEAAYRHNLPIPELDEVVTFHLRHASALLHLAEFTVQWFRRGALDEATSRHLGALHLAEWRRIATRDRTAAPPLPHTLERLLDYLERNLQETLTIDRLTRLADCSRATLNRLFRKHLRTTPILWINERRMAKAAELLSHSTLTVAEVGMRVGIDDPSYFSKLFRQQRGCSCTAWRKQGSLYQI